MRTPTWQATGGSDRFDIALCKLDLGSEGFERFEVQVDRAISDRTTSWHRNGRLPHPGQHRAKDQDRCAHLANQIVGSDSRRDPRGFKCHHSPEIFGARALDRSGDPELVHQVLEPVNVRQPRQIPQGQRFFGQESARDQSERGILRARNWNCTRQPVAATNNQFVHGNALTAFGPPRKARGEVHTIATHSA